MLKNTGRTMTRIGYSFSLSLLGVGEQGLGAVGEEGRFIIQTRKERIITMQILTSGPYSPKRLYHAPSGEAGLPPQQRGRLHASEVF
jgi:hypothetical protein